MAAHPAISIVVAARNDNYGGDFAERCNGFVAALLELARKELLDYELVVVEWNPPPDRVALLDAVPALKSASGRVRVLRVPAAVHAALANSDRMAMFEYFAKNAGIRRAHGHFVLVTNPDVLFSGQMIALLASGTLSDACYYRADRYDFHGRIDPSRSAAENLKAAKSSVYRVNVREIWRSAVQIGAWRRRLALATGRWPGTWTGLKASLGARYATTAISDGRGAYGGPHTNAAGDFLLAPKFAWEQIRGFPERTDTFTHLDSYACTQLYAAGYQQRLIRPPAMILHPDHDRTEQKARPTVSGSTWREDLDAIRHGRLGPALNGTDWGLADVELLEAG